MRRQAEVREATIFDLLGIGELALRYEREAVSMHKHTLDLNEFMKNIAMSLTARTGYVSILVVDGDIRGCFWGCLTNMPWSSRKFAQDICFFVDDECRGYGMWLIRRWVKWAKAQGAVEVCLSSASGIDTDRTIQLFKDIGFTKLGEAYSKELS